ncbi:MAG: hypothetical protein H0V54_12275 [Chthoniobacterales bacterium]|nr:hypothetical protein [Chthoniobacterales bacterium]
MTAGMPTHAGRTLLIFAIGLLLINVAMGDADSPCSELANATSFSFGATIYAGKIVSGQRAFSAVLHTRNPKSCFKKLMMSGNIQSKMYALVGLRELDPAQFRVELNRLREQRFAVVVLATEESGAIKSKSGEAVLKEIAAGLFHRDFLFARDRLLQVD